MRLEVGQQIGNYRVIRSLGEGGTGVVYEVEHVQLGVHYALKAFTLATGHVETLRQKFLTEGKLLARLRSRNIVRVYDLSCDEATNTLYFVMDLVLAKGGHPCSLADIKIDDFDEDSVFRWFSELARTLDFIHSQGIVHRDIKLSNVLLAEDGRAILSDFGISRLCSNRLRGAVNAVNTMVTEAGALPRFIMGTQGYMAPEIIRGEEATPAADVYALGVMFVYLLTGIWYESGSKVFALLESLEYRWNEVLPKLLAENPLDRPTDLTALVETLRKDPDVASDGRKAKRRGNLRRAALWFLALVSSVVIAIGGYIFVNKPLSNNVDDFDDAFGLRGIYESDS
ncbi:MAG: serine/threonine protein kinase [Kiritimatiellae bacterium]|nr:serine/threonine protein kinase [Kiritimatiellia bacterium]